METLASVWARGVGLEAECVFNSSPPAGGMWAEQLSPHLQRNKQLQDTLLQREEELTRLQEENNKLRQFLNSSFVRNLEEKAKKLSTDGRRKLKRNLTYRDDFQNCSQQLLDSQQVSKRVCRNLTAEFLAAETTAPSEPNLDLWVLRTLGLKDRDTIDVSSTSMSEFNPRRLLDDAAAFSPDLCQSSAHHGECDYSAAQNQETPHAIRSSAPHRSGSPGQSSDFTASGLSRHPEAPEAVIASFNSTVAFHPRPLSEERPLTGSGPPQPFSSAFWSTPSLGGSRSTSQVTTPSCPPAETAQASLLYSPLRDQSWTPGWVGPVSPPAACQTPRSRTDLAFSMSLSPSSSVRTHSFPQGQAFVRKDPHGRWNFTWVPRQEP